MDPFERASQKYPNLYFVSGKLDLVPDAEVDELERRLGFELPAGYREFMTTVGACEYCNNLHIPGPRVLMENGGPLTLEETIGDFNPWKPAESGLTKQQIMEVRCIGGTGNGDYVGLHRSQPKMIFFLPEGHDDVIRVDSNETPYPDFYWRCVSNELWGAGAPYVEPYDNRERNQITLTATSLSEQALFGAISKRWGDAGIRVYPRPHREETTWFVRALQGRITYSRHEGKPYVMSYSVDTEHAPAVDAFLKGIGVG